jgi:hypothetical protein
MREFCDSSLLPACSQSKLLKAIKQQLMVRILPHLIIVVTGKRHLSAHLFSALRQFMLAQNHAACSAVSERGAPFYERNIGHAHHFWVAPNR